ncbi:pyruvate:ferredoxin oxidoreductase subunit delta [Candidatus Termititenax persephonae]|uniref:Pyruvate:ferredoxin oxidoreductase subunit delta n=1 Tax=Candidatus Termititenax persephonae TaxID=2218525 RepID=A0A388TFI5_9BACT|nr:pyruvate:ferredoxin oxidoreductase subunit delta [Candidatus Termititenax persephonae]
MTFTAGNYTGKLTVTELPEGGIWTEPGSSLMRKTGDWKTLQPVWDGQKCISCLTCWAYCPDSCFKTEKVLNEKTGKEDVKNRGIDLDHCKGCGICAAVCPPKVAAITMEKAR